MYKVGRRLQISMGRSMKMMQGIHKKWSGLAIIIDEELKEVEVLMKIVKKYLLHLLFERQISILGMK